jgi:hypothetical protein
LSTGTLEDTLFYIFLNEYEAKYANNSVELVCQEYLFPFLSLHFPFRMTPSNYTAIHFQDVPQAPRILLCLQQAAIATVLLQKVANLLSTPTFATTIAAWPSYVLDLIRSLLKDNTTDPSVHCEPTGAPDSAQLYLLQLIQPSQLLKVLKSKESLERLNIYNTWMLTDSIMLLRSIF